MKVEKLYLFSELDETGMFDALHNRVRVRKDSARKGRRTGRKTCVRTQC